jgi:hypothetical protein
METGGRIAVAYGFIIMRIPGLGDGVRQRGHVIDLLIDNDLQFILGPAFRIILIFFVFFLQAFAEIAFAIAFHFRPIPVLAKIFGNVFFIQLIAEEHDIPAESLSQHAYQ